MDKKNNGLPAAATKKAEPGRPPSIRGERVQVYLDAASQATAAALGGGNVSLGIRLALQAASRRKP